MLIPVNQILECLEKHEIRVSGVLHIGAHDCEEMGFYNNSLKIRDEQVFWIDALPFKVAAALKKGIPNVFHAVVSDKDNEIVEFNVSNNFQSSSILDLKTHAQEHPSVVYTHKIRQTTTTVDTFLESNNIQAELCNFWNFDIQGAELLALKGATNSLKFAKALYLEVNEKELYKGCGLIGEIDSFLKDYGFTRVLTYMKKQGWGDALYVRETV
jgi:FkbM family methyltransferase